MRKCRQVKTSLAITTNGKTCWLWCQGRVRRAEQRVRSTEWVLIFPFPPELAVILIPREPSTHHRADSIHSAACDWVACSTATLLHSAPGAAQRLRASRQRSAAHRIAWHCCVTLKLNSAPVQPIGLAVTNTADIVIAIVIVNYVLRAYLLRSHILKVSLASRLTYWHAKLTPDRSCVGGARCGDREMEMATIRCQEYWRTSRGIIYINDERPWLW